MIDVKTLRAGDKVRRIKENNTAYKFTKDKEYTVFQGVGQIFIHEDNGDTYGQSALEANAQRWEHVKPAINLTGQLEIVGRVSLDSTEADVEYTAMVRMDANGLKALRKLEKDLEVNTDRERKIEKLEAELERLKQERETI